MGLSLRGQAGWAGGSQWWGQRDWGLGQEPFTTSMEVFQYFSNRCSCSSLRIRYRRQGKIEERIRKEKANIWVMHEVSKREELGIRLWFLLGQPGKLI